MTSKIVREGWAKAATKMIEAKDDRLLDGEIVDHFWDEEEWEW